MTLEQVEILEHIREELERLLAADVDIDIDDGEVVEAPFIRVVVPPGFYMPKAKTQSLTCRQRLSLWFSRQ
jgi:hypothetical protein